MGSRVNLSQIKSKLPLLSQPLILVAAIAIPAACVALLAEAATLKPLTSYQIQLRSQVQAPNGAPLSGRDPDMQMQTSLTAAASQPVGNGLRVDKPAAKVVGDRNHHVQPADVLPNSSATGLSITGCLTGYPFPGEKCVTKNTTTK